MGPSPAHNRKPSSSPATKLTTLPLIALIFYDVSGGPFGLEDSVRAGAGALLPLLGLLLFPLLWSLPEALITAELASSLPSNAGYVLWVSSAFGPFMGFQEGFWKWTSGAMDNALYPVLFLDYLRPSLPFFSSGAGRFPTIWILTAALTFLNYRGLHIVGISAVVLTVFSVSPFIALVVLSLPRLRPRRWLTVDLKRVDLRGYFNSMLWNLNYWDKASTLAGEVEDPARSFPKAVFGALVLVVGSYLLPLLAGTGAMEGMKAGEWGDGYFAEVGMSIGGAWLKLWIQAAAAMSNMGLFEAEMSGDSFQLLGMSEIGMLPAFFSSRSKYGTPTISILLSATGVIFLSWMSFQEIIEFLNFLYALGMLLEFAAFIQLRIKRPDLHRPYKVPVGTYGAIAICIPPALLLILVMCLASLRTFIVSGIIMLIGFVLYPAIQLMKNKQWVRFIDPSEPVESYFETTALRFENVADEASLSLLPEFSSIKHELPEKEPDLETKLE
ncbi:probable polyamine transporter At3g19553 isoform X1 [Dioscorea cayenensis subsp. rotundata]|uniref:Polyamine transporter PUT1 n=1 Tax=Dioscorea cayennensis subsp. rotundata TaxID=55577 RepID=A0AB40CIT5_DIOCR|nr:probable polyamine transporter At3g19553 isoform X1 [Dioscorea cayenensis subsp. rotundata]